jgi:hypothetical protein
VPAYCCRSTVGAVVSGFFVFFESSPATRALMTVISRGPPSRSTCSSAPAQDPAPGAESRVRERRRPRTSWNASSAEAAPITMVGPFARQCALSERAASEARASEA